MTRIFIILVLILNVSLALASPQSGDYFIIKKDTFNVQHYPLYLFFKKYPSSALENKIQNDSSFALSAVRGYEATWKIVNDSLFLVDIDIEGNTEEILRKTFSENFKNGRVFAFWYSNSIFIPNGKRIRNNPYFRTCENEISFNFLKGKLKKKKEITNYIKVKNGISRHNNKTVSDTLFYFISKNLDWEYLGDKFCDDNYDISINSKGKISKVKFVPLLDTKWENFWYNIANRKCRRKIFKAIKKLKFDIVLVHGKKYNESIRIDILYDNDENKLYNYTN